MDKLNGCLYKLYGPFWTDIWSEIRPYFIKLSVHFVIFSLTLSTLFLAQLVYKVTQDFSRDLFIDLSNLIIILYISDLMSAMYLIYYLNKSFFHILFNRMKKR